MDDNYTGQQKNQKNSTSTRSIQIINFPNFTFFLWELRNLVTGTLFKLLALKDCLMIKPLLYLNEFKMYFIHLKENFSSANQSSKR